MELRMCCKFTWNLKEICYNKMRSSCSDREGELYMNTESFDLSTTELSFGVCCYRIEKNGEGEQKKYTFVDANQAFFACMGYEREFFERQEQVLEQILAMNERKEAKNWIHMAEEKPGAFFGGIVEILQKNGNRKHLKWKVCCQEGARGMSYLIFSCTSVNLLIKTQKELLDKLNKEKSERRKASDLIYELPFGVAVVRGNQNFQFEVANDAFLKLTGCPSSAVSCGQAFMTDYVHEEDLGRLEEAVERCQMQKSPEEFELRLKTAEGQTRWELLQCQLYYYKDAIPYYMIATWDINDRKELEDELKLLDEQYRMLEEVTDEFPFEYDVIQDRFRIPHKYYKMGKIHDPGQKYMTLEETCADIYREDCAAYKAALEKAKKQEMSGTIDYRLNVSPAGEEPHYNWYRTVYRSIPGTNGGIIRIIGRSYDISSDRKIQEKLSEEMRLDPLTRLLNKVATGEEVKKYISEKPEGTQVLFLIDIDNFKRVNDTFGHTVGDTVISDIAQLIQEHFQDTDIVGRVGGDEFLVFMKNTTLEGAVRKARELCSGSGKQLIGDDAVVNVTLSVGVAVYGVDGEDYSSLFQMADRAMYHIKRNGKNSYSLAQDGDHVYDNVRGEKQVDAVFEKRQEIDKDFMNVAFSLLSHAKDMNGSLNVLLEQIGKKYHLDMLSVVEYEDDVQQMKLTNYWSNFGQVYENTVMQRSIRAFEEAVPGEFVLVKEKGRNEPAVLYENWNTGDRRICYLGGVKFEYGSSHTGCLFLGSRQKERIFDETERMTYSELSRVVAVFVTLRNKLSDDQKEIRHLQSRDRLTGLYNLETFRNRTEELLAWEAREEETHCQYAMVHVDINNFSYVNENFGLTVGDRILTELGQMVGRLEQVPFACRMYSDYFVLLVKGADKEEILKNVSSAKEYFEIQQKRKYPAASMRLSVGIYYIDNPKEGFDSILESSNLARKQAKEFGSIKYCVYHESFRAKRDDEIHVTGRFYTALQKGEFEMFLQPKFLLNERKVYGAEALARWRTPEGNLVPPVKFIPPLENIGYIVDLDFYILEQLLRVMRRWKKAGKQLITVSTNFSRKNFENGGEDFIERLEGTMKRYGIEPKYIEIEITEGVIVENLQELKQCLMKLEELGYRIAIDDFGTGYSSLSVLLEIPANVIKIDKSFTDKINLSEQRKFVSYMGQFIYSAKEEVIFEGIETEEQLEFLSSCGFKYGQGYLMDKPISVEEFEKKYI